MKLSGMLLVLVTLAAASPTPLAAQRMDDAARVRQAVSGQLTSRVALAAEKETIGPSAIEAEKIENRGGLTVWFGRPAADHAVRSLVAFDSTGTLFPLGGFEHPELIGASRALGPVMLDAGHLRARAREFTYLADIHGGEELISPDSLVPRSRLEGFWRERKPSDWPRDTIVVSAEMSIVRLTVLSHHIPTLAPTWTAICYSFVFDAKGNLTGWTRRIGPQLPDIW